MKGGSLAEGAAVHRQKGSSGKRALRALDAMQHWPALEHKAHGRPKTQAGRQAGRRSQGPLSPAEASGPDPEGPGEPEDPEPEMAKEALQRMK